MEGEAGHARRTYFELTVFAVAKSGVRIAENPSAFAAALILQSPLGYFGGQIAEHPSSRRIECSQVFFSGPSWDGVAPGSLLAAV